MDQITKRKLVDYLYSVIDISKYKYELISKKGDAKKFLLAPYFMSGNFVGDNCFLIFTKLKDSLTSSIINRKTLNYTKPKNLDKVEAFNISVKTDLSIYDGSIFDGHFIKQINGQHVFIITDVFIFKGKDMSNFSIDIKLHKMKEYVDKCVSVENQIKPGHTGLKISVNKIHDLTYLKNYVNNIGNSEFKIRGICFYPETSGTKLIFMFNQQRTPNQRNNVVQQSHHSPQKSLSPVAKKEPKYMMVNNTGDILTAVLSIEQSSFPDVYNLFAIKRFGVAERDGKKIYEKVSMDVAYLPNANKSKWCKELFNKESKNILVNCTFNDDKHKWEPTEVAKGIKMPTFYDQIEIDIFKVDD